MLINTMLSKSELTSTIPLTENSKAVLKRRYLRRGPDGTPIETIEEMFHRVAGHIASVEGDYGCDVVATEEKFYNLLTELRFLPNSPTFTGAGTPLGQLSACFVLPISDDMGREEGGIFQTLRDAALIQQTGGGNGFAFSHLRPKGDLVKTSAGHATGPVGFLRVYDQAFGEVAQGGCLTPDTLVFTSAGLLRLDELVEVDESGWQEHKLEVATDEGVRFSPRGYNNGVVPVLQVRTHEGLVLTGTYNHKVKVMTEQGPVWRRFDELAIGDSILVMLGQHRGSEQPLRHPNVHDGNQEQPSFPNTLNEDLAFLLGYMAGDGFVASGESQNHIGFSVAHSSYLIQRMHDLIRELFPGATIQTQQKQNNGSVTFVIDNRSLKEFMMMNGFTNPLSDEVFVPRLIRQSSPEVVGAYLRGLFEADGHVVHGYPSLSTLSGRLKREVTTLLIGLGCPLSLRTISSDDRRGGDSERLAIKISSHVGLQAWQEKIGCDPESRFQVCYLKKPDGSREYSYQLPFARYWIEPVLQATRLAQIDKRGRGMNKNFRSTSPKLRRKLLRYARGDRNLTLSGYKRLAAEHSEFAEHAHPVGNLWFTTVTSVQEIGESLTLDLEVEENHTYLANGLVTHNTRRGANMAVLRVNHPDIYDFVSCKANEYAITNFNISVGITDDFMHAVQNDTDFDLVNPRDGKIWRTIRARDLFDEIVKYAHANGEPGVLFLDAANRTNPVPHLYELESTNPCITGDTLVYTANGIQRADTLAAEGQPDAVVVDGRFGVATLQPSSGLFRTGTKDVYRVTTREGYEIRLTANHQIMTTKGWVEASELRLGDEVHILNRPGAFGMEGSRELGLVLGGLVGDGSIHQIRALLPFFGEEKIEVAPMMAEAVTTLVDIDHYSKRPTRSYPVGLTEIPERDEVRIQSDLLMLLGEHGLDEEKLQVPDVILRGCEAAQQAFLQTLFTTDGTVNDDRNKGCSVRLTSVSYELLQDVQRLLLNFGIASRIYRERRPAGMRRLPDGKGGYREYWCRAYHELAISKDNLIRFAERVGFLSETKQTALLDYLSRMTQGPSRERFTAHVTSIEYDGREMVYDLKQPTTHSFIANGFVVHNCGEQWLGPYENCCLGSINLGRHVTDDGQVDWEKLQETIVDATHFLDNVVTVNAYVPAVPQLKEAAYKARRIGLGIMGLADLMYHLGVRYGSQEGQLLASKVMEFVRYHCMRTSIKLARERGAFPAIKGSIYDPDHLRWQVPTPLVDGDQDWARPLLHWDSLVADLKEYGIRNAAQTTVAPTGTIASVAGCEGYGCEPVFALAYIRHFNDQGKDVELQYTSPLFEQALVRAAVDPATRARVVSEVTRVGTCQHIEEVPRSVRNTFVVAGDITPEEHVRMQAAIQAFVDNSISKTINFPNHATQEDVATAYELAWKLGCKGITVYVTGSREKVVLETHETKAAKDKSEAEAGEEKNSPTTPNYTNRGEHKRTRPRRLAGATYSVDTPVGKAYVTVNRNGNEQPFEVFANVGKVGSEGAAMSEAIGRMISLVLRLPSDISPNERLEMVVEQLEGIGGPRSVGFGLNRVTSLPDALAQVLREDLDIHHDAEAAYLLNEVQDVAGRGFNGKPAHHEPESKAPQQERFSPSFDADLCPECGHASFVRTEGCRKCYSCSYSEC